MPFHTIIDGQNMCDKKRPAILVQTTKQSRIKAHRSHGIFIDKK
jgi:hypothetical protein